MVQSYFVEKALEVDPREAKLPAWARDKLETMRRTTIEARKDLTALKAGSEPGPFWLEKFDDETRFYLPSNMRLMFGLGDGKATLWLAHNTNHTPQDEWLEVHGLCAGVIVRPWCSNVLLLRGLGDLE